MIVPGNRATCGTLRCTDEADLSQKLTISKMSVFRKGHFGGGESLITSVSKGQPLISRNNNGAKIDGSWSKHRAEITLFLLRPGECRGTQFSCEVHAVDDEGKEIVSRSSVWKPDGKDAAAGECSGRDVAAQLKDDIKQIKVWLEKAVDKLENRLEDKIVTLQTRMDDKIINLQSRIDDKISTFENRLEDKLLSTQNRFDDNVRQLENRLEDKLDLRVMPAAPTSNQTQERCMSNFDAAEVVLNETILSLESMFNATTTQAILDIHQMFESEKGIFLADASRMSDKIRATLDKLATYSNISNSTEIAATLGMRPTRKTSCDRQSSESERPVLESYHVITPPFGESPYVCDPHTSGGGWIVIQRRTTGNVDFEKDWASYKEGFGAFDDDFWLGNDLIHELTSKGTYELRVDLKHHGNSLFAHYSYFYLEDETKNYALRLGTFSGTADDVFPFRKSIPFSTWDRDNDGVADVSCALKYRGGWWFWPANCFNSFLNGKWVPETSSRPRWGENSVVFSEMKMRRVQG